MSAQSQVEVFGKALRIKRFGFFTISRTAASRNYARGSRGTHVAPMMWCILGECVFDRLQHPVFAAAQPIVVSLIDPLNDSVFVDKQGGRDRHGLERGGERERDTEQREATRFEPKRLVMLDAVLPDDLEIGIRQQSQTQIVTGFVRGRFLDRILAQGDQADAVFVEVCLHRFEAPQLGAAIGSPASAEELQQRSLACQ